MSYCAGSIAPGHRAQAAVPAAPAGWQVLFRGDFEHRDGAWTAQTTTLTTPLSAVEDDVVSAVYAALSHTMAVASAGPWRDFRFHLRGRYFAALGGGPVSLTPMVVDVVAVRATGRIQ